MRVTIITKLFFFYRNFPIEIFLQQKSRSLSSTTVLYLLPLSLSGPSSPFFKLSLHHFLERSLLFQPYVFQFISNLSCLSFPILFNWPYHLHLFSPIFFTTFAVTFKIFRIVVFVFLSNLEIPADCLQKSISVAKNFNYKFHTSQVS